MPEMTFNTAAGQAIERDMMVGDKLAFSGRSDTMYMETDET